MRITLATYDNIIISDGIITIMIMHPKTKIITRNKARKIDKMLQLTMVSLLNRNRLYGSDVEFNIQSEIFFQFNIQSKKG